MEFLVTVTTHVPPGTQAETVDDIRAREAARSWELATQGHLLRLWRPPLQPGEWRTIGLFAADDDRQLDNVLTSMPLPVWRADDITPLAPHPNDPAATRTAAAPNQGRDAVEFLTTLTITVPGGRPDGIVDDTKARDAYRAHELASQGHLLRLWTATEQAGPMANVRAVERPECRRADRDTGIPAAVRLDGRGGHAADPAPE